MGLPLAAFADRPSWITRRAPAIRALALVLSCSIPVTAWAFPSIAGTLVWNVLIASVPLLTVRLGYHLWRRVCPLAFIASLGQHFIRFERRRAGPFLEANYHYIALGGFVIAAWLRLTVVNGDAEAIVALFAAVSVLAFTVGTLFTGKTWCNFFCPVSFIEKIYTEPTTSSTGSNSQCVACSGCKRACPDIDQEAAFWKEISSGAKRLVYFAFPGLVVSFFLYSYLQSGDWAAYFDLGWANQPGPSWSVFLPGHDASTAGFVFLTAIPRAVAAMLTLLAGAGLSVAFFSLGDGAIRRFTSRRGRVSDRRRTQQWSFVVAGAVAFAAFYGFAVLPMFSWSPALGLGCTAAIAAVGLRMVVSRLRRRPPAAARPSQYGRPNVAGHPAFNATPARAAVVISPLSIEVLHQRQRLSPRSNTVH